MSPRIRLHPLVLAALFWPIAFASAEAQQQGTVTGRVTDAGSGQPIVAAQVAVVGTARGIQRVRWRRSTRRASP